ncbi:hypothetical protein DPMN_045435 [Dreissena polymorpha]|uniref:Uncharacterized protein n=1 Tax=Dreissena polymorpha TaxID=45954 RepID=A0A9D4HXA7_DREPO|nr:hypothetical protein DPMN_045356 [Dreissena polymorpha]KAH3738792.1 hypothetical protein DPMN_045435 [Dreissena polymorpha]
MDTSAIASLQCQMREMGHSCHSELAMSDEINGTQLGEPAMSNMRNGTQLP